VSEPIDGLERSFLFRSGRPRVCAARRSDLAAGSGSRSRSSACRCTSTTNGPGAIGCSRHARRDRCLPPVRAPSRRRPGHPDCPFEHVTVIFGTRSPNRDANLRSVAPKVRALRERRYPQLTTTRLADGSAVKLDAQRGRHQPDSLAGYRSDRRKALRTAAHRFLVCSAILRNSAALSLPVALGRARFAGFGVFGTEGGPVVAFADRRRGLTADPGAPAAGAEAAALRTSTPRISAG